MFYLRMLAVQTNSPIPCRSPTIPRICHSESDLSSPRQSTAWEQHGMCELVSAVLRRHMGDLPEFREWHGRGRAGAVERHGNGMVCVNSRLTRQGNGMVCLNPALPSSETIRGERMNAEYVVLLVEWYWQCIENWFDLTCTIDGPACQTARNVKRIGKLIVGQLTKHYSVFWAILRSAITTFSFFQWWPTFGFLHRVVLNVLTFRKTRCFHFQVDWIVMSQRQFIIWRSQPHPRFAAWRTIPVSNMHLYYGWCVCGRAWYCLCFLSIKHNLQSTRLLIWGVIQNIPDCCRHLYSSCGSANHRCQQTKL
jgi:hypothetical protein